MHKVLIALAVTALTAGPTAAPAQSDVIATVTQYVAAFNKGDTKAAVALCTDQASIIDEFPPHEWQGAGACQRWMNDFEAQAKKDGITDAIVTLGTPRHVDVTGDRAYVVIPSDYTFKEKGKPMKETGSTFTFALQKVAAGWRITGWTWSKS